MDYSIIFARHFARLVWLLVHEPSNTDEQKAALRAMVTISRDGPVHLVRREDGITANATALPGALPGVPDLLERLRRHGVDELLIEAGVAPADLLTLARALAAADPSGASAGALALATIRVGATPAATAEVAASPAAAPASPPPAPSPASHAEPAQASAPAVSTAGILNLGEGLGMDLELVEPEEAHAAIVEKLGEAAVPEPAPAAPVELVDVMASFAPLLQAGDAQAILARFDVTTAPRHRLQMLEEIALLAERSAREGKAMLVADLTGGLVTRESEAPEGSEDRRMLARTVRRLLKGGLLRQVAMLLPRKRGRIDEYEAVLMRAGEDGADALIEQLTQATTAEDWRTYYSLLVRLRAGVSALVHMLGDHRWYVVRNAADLLGEMQAREGEQALVGLLRHADERVRRAASTALVRIGTPRAVQAVHEVLRDESREMRLLAATALGARKDHPTAQTLVGAYETEEDEEVQLAIVAALGRVGTADAVQRLVQIAQPGGRIFRKKSAALRLAAVQALSEVGSAAAVSALRALTNDREKEVKEAAVRAVGRD